MAGDWIKMRVDLFTHPKVVRISSALKADRLRTVGGLMSVWCLFDAHSIDGKLDGYDIDSIDEAIRWPGFSEQMCRVGWMFVESQSLVLPEFDTHNGASAKRRAQDSDRKKVVRKMSASEADKCPQNVRSREEKRREEKRTEEDSTEERAAARPVCLLPLNTGPDFQVTQDHLSEFKAAYPAVEILQQLKAMRVWIIANPTKRKTKSGILRFVNAWLSKEQDSPSRARQSHCEPANANSVAASRPMT